jgi:hypothetical protein
MMKPAEPAAADVVMEALVAAAAAAAAAADGNSALTGCTMPMVGLTTEVVADMDRMERGA